jgi:anthranilate synthase component 2
MPLKQLLEGGFILILIIDNYDSFTYNLVDLIQSCTTEAVKVLRNDHLDIETVKQLNPSAIVISPGPCSPLEAGYSVQVVKDFGGQIPILGICLGHQSIGAAYGATIEKVNQLMHGQIDQISTGNSILFKGIETIIQGTRYHSLMVRPEDLPPTLRVVASSHTDGAIMALEDITQTIFGLQFHPESYGTPTGKAIMTNFLTHCLHMTERRLI